MTLMTMSACRWQYNRYHYSINKWKVLDEQFQKEEPDQIQFSNLPWQEQLIKTNKLNIEDFEYRLIRLKGLLKGQRFFIHRHQDGRPGYLIVAPFIDSTQNTNNALVVNLGWIPSNMKQKFDNLKYKDEEIELSALIKRPEKIDYVNQQQIQQMKKMEQINQSTGNQEQTSQQQNLQNQDSSKIIPEQSRFNSFIDLEFLKKEFNCNLDTNAYLEKFISRKQYNQLSISDSDDDLYPVCSSPQTFSKPYLTPDKHLSYCTFWGCCTTFGIITIIRALRV
ncbi:hypothetical protein ABPG74_014893 [Tetrahymena malaccensis]